MVMTINDKVILVEDIGKINSLMGKTKKDILRLLSKDDLCCSELADELEKERSNIYRHVRALQEVGFVKVKREEKINYKTKKIYEKSADLFIPIPETFEASKSSNISVTWDEENTEQIMNILSEIGFEIDEDFEQQKKIVDFFRNMDKAVKNLLKKKKELEEPSLFKLMKIKLLILFVELNYNENIHEKFEKINKTIQE